MIAGGALQTVAFAGPAAEPLLSVDEVSRVFRIPSTRLFGRGERVAAVDRVTLAVAPGEVLGIVGESGSGKTTLARMLMRFDRPSGGVVRYAGQDLWEMDRHQVRALRRDVQMVFQDPQTSLDPRMSVFASIEEPLRIHRDFLPRAKWREHVRETMELVGLDWSMAGRFPHQFSGGQRQRIGIARAICLRPKVLICDEPVSALDVSVQAQIMNLFLELQQQFGLTFVFIAHDLAVVRHFADRVAVMHRGSVIEQGPAQAILSHPTDPYTRALIDADPA